MWAQINYINTFNLLNLRLFSIENRGLTLKKKLFNWFECNLKANKIISESEN